MTNEKAEMWMHRALEAEAALAHASSDLVRQRRLLSQVAARAEQGMVLGPELAEAAVAEAGGRVGVAPKLPSELSVSHYLTQIRCVAALAAEDESPRLAMLGRLLGAEVDSMVQLLWLIEEAE